MKRIRTTDYISAALALLACISLESAPRAAWMLLAAGLIQAADALAQKIKSRPVSGITGAAQRKNTQPHYEAKERKCQDGGMEDQRAGA